MAAVFFTGMGIGLCLVAAACVIFLMTGFKRMTLRDIDSLAIRDARAAQKWRRLVLNQDKIVSSLFTAYVFLLSAATTAMAYFWLAELSFAAMVLHIFGVTLFILLLTYYLPKSYALNQESDFMLKWFPLLQLFSTLFFVMMWGVTHMGHLMTSFSKKHFQHMSHLIAAEQEMNFIIRYRSLMAAQDPEGLKEIREQRRIIKLLEEYKGKKLADIMIDFADIPMIDGEQSMEELAEKILSSQAKRMIMYQETPEQIIGILHVDLFIKAMALAEGDLNAIDLMSAVSEPLYMNDQQNASEQIYLFKQHKQNFALLQNRQGQVIGGIAQEDLLEQAALLFIQDETDSA